MTQPNLANGMIARPIQIALFLIGGSACGPGEPGSSDACNNVEGCVDYRIPQSFALGENHTCRIEDVVGHVECWGDNREGLLGVGSTADVARGRVLDIVGAQSLAAGDSHTCALLSNRSVACWGRNSEGQLGRGRLSERESAPAVVDGLNEVDALALNHNTSCARLALGEVRCWGDNSGGQVVAEGPLNVMVPTAVEGLEDATMIAVGNYHICAVKGGEVTCTGSLATPIFSETVDAVSAGWEHSCLISKGVVSCWGSGYLGTLGFPIDSSKVPIPVPGLDNSRVTLSTKTYHSCALGSDGTLECWGNNQGGAIDPSSPNEPNYRATVIATDILQVAVGGVHICVADPSMRCWGNDWAGAVTGMPR